MTQLQFEQVREFAGNASLYDHIYGHAVVLHKDTRQPIGSYPINCKHEKPINYFLGDNTICTTPYVDIKSIHLNKRLAGQHEYITITITSDE